MMRTETCRLKKQLLAFLSVGMIGFLCDAVFFTLFFSVLGMSIVPARLLAFLPATVVTWLLNRNIAFKGQSAKLGKKKEYLKYLMVQGAGIAVNFGTFFITQKFFLELLQFPVIPLALGSGAALIFNFIGAKLFVFTE